MLHANACYQDNGTYELYVDAVEEINGKKIYRREIIEVFPDFRSLWQYLNDDRNKYDVVGICTPIPFK
ncbi:MAG TPA: hypothetical protein DC057_11940 [Spirochaetia bacterium]|nr:hypothetical protein [Spirochaetia bacterium]